MSLMMQNTSTTEEVEDAIGRSMRQWRIDAGYSQEELGARAGVSRSAVRSLESGRGSRIQTLVRVLSALGRLDALASLRPREGLSPIEALAAQRSAAAGRVDHPRVRRPRS